jgi:hypothetical protein
MSSIPGGLLADLLDLGPLYQLADNWWNVGVADAPLDPKASQLRTAIINDAGGIGSAKLWPDFGTGVGMPYAVVEAGAPIIPIETPGTPRVLFTPGTYTNDPASDFDYCTESDYGIGGVDGYPIPVEARTNPRYMENGEYGHGGTGDAHLLVLEVDTLLLYELSYASPIADGKWHAGAGAIWNLWANDRRPDTWTSTDAAGLAVLPGLMRYDEIVLSAGAIRHAFRTSLRKSNGYVWPASHSRQANAGSPPMGLRMRLQASFDIEAYLAGRFSSQQVLLNEAQKTAMRRILQALKSYGLIVADGGGAMYCQGTMDSRWDLFWNAQLRNAVFSGINVNSFDIIQRGWSPTGVVGSSKRVNFTV